MNTPIWSGRRMEDVCAIGHGAFHLLDSSILLCPNILVTKLSDHVGNKPHKQFQTKEMWTALSRGTHTTLG